MYVFELKSKEWSSEELIYSHLLYWFITEQALVHFLKNFWQRQTFAMRAFPKVTDPKYCKHWIGTRNQAFESLIAQEISCATSYIILFVMQPCSVHSQTAPPIQAETFLSPFPNCLYYLVSTTLVFPSLLPLAFICIINWIYLCEETLRGLDSAKRVNNFYHQ